MEKLLSPQKKLQNLVDMAQSIKFDSTKPLRYYIVLANELEKRGKCAIFEKRFEEAFVNLVRMLLVLISYIPKHPDYAILDQKICNNLGAMKERYFCITSKIKQLLKKTYENESFKYECLHNDNVTKSQECEYDRDFLIDDDNNNGDELITFTNEKSPNNFENNASCEYNFDPYSSSLSYVEPITNRFKQSSSTSKINNNSSSIVSYAKINSIVPKISYNNIVDRFEESILQQDDEQNSCQVAHTLSSSSSSSSSASLRFNRLNSGQQTQMSNIFVKNEQMATSKLQKQLIFDNNPKEIDLLGNNSFSDSLPELENFSSPNKITDLSFDTQYQTTNHVDPHDMLSHYIDEKDTILNNIVDRSLKPPYYPSHIVTNSNNLLFSNDVNTSIDYPSNEVTVSTIFDNTDEVDDKSLSVIIPGDTVKRFTYEAMGDIRKNVETLGIIAGININNNYHVTHILIPKQKGTPDSCESLNDHQIFLYQIKNDLLTLGWIHTHPTQSCFLSSVDVHTHYSYQCQLDRAIAIVVSHQKKTDCVFNLTAHGMATIKGCNQRGFHPHGSDIFQVCPFAIIDNTKRIKVVDLRKN